MVGELEEGFLTWPPLVCLQSSVPPSGAGPPRDAAAARLSSCQRAESLLRSSIMACLRLEPGALVQGAQRLAVVKLRYAVM
jgi:hypothetical protein